MTEQNAEQIHEASVALLEDPGIRIEHEQIAGMLLKHGARAGVGVDVVRLPRQMIEEYLALCPSRFALCDRAGGSIMLSPECSPSFWSCPGMSLYRHGQHRRFLGCDMGEMARLLEQLEQVQVIFGMSLGDVPPTAQDVVGLNIIARNSRKHARVLCFSPEGARTLVEMKGVVGDYAWFSIGFTAHGPLRWTNLALEIFRCSAGHGIPTSVNGEPMAGVSAPVTVAGAAAVGNAEILAGLVINQILEPGRPCIYNLGLGHVFDMRTAVAVTGGPENALLGGLSALMGRFYQLPSASWVSTESMCPDQQAGLEKMFGFQTHMRSGVSCIWGVGQLESEMTISPAQAVIDNEMIAYARHYGRGAGFDDESLAVEVTRSVGIAGSFLEHDHTLRHYRDELFAPRVLLRKRRAVWAQQGSKTLEQRAEEIADELIGRQGEPALTPEQAWALQRITDGFVARMGMDT